MACEKCRTTMTDWIGESCIHEFTPSKPKVCAGCAALESEIRRLRECDTKDAQENAALRERVKELEKDNAEFKFLNESIAEQRIKDCERAEQAEAVAEKAKGLVLRHQDTEIALRRVVEAAREYLRTKDDSGPIAEALRELEAVEREGE